MPGYEVFPNAPVEEAIITVRVSRLDLSSGMERLQDALHGLYPVVDTRDKDEATSGTVSAATPRLIRFLSTDRQQAVQVSPQAFSFHRLRPYTRWEVFANDARIAWEAFATVFAPSIQDVQLRYLNLIQLPAEFEDWGDYLMIHPNLPAAVDTGLASYFISLSLSDGSVPATAIVVTQATADEVEEGLIEVVFDIDTRSALPGPEDAAQLWAILEGLREYKNRLFFEGLTERAKELFR